MYCPFCHALDTKVIDSRLVAEGATVKRRRACPACHERFTTFETPALDMPWIIKRDGRRETFNIKNLQTGMLTALEKRSVPAERVQQAIDSIVSEIRARGEREIHSRNVGELVMSQLYQLDHVAYVRFASVYKRFQDVSEFKQTIDDMG